MTRTFVVPLKVLMALEMVEKDKFDGVLAFVCKHGGVRDAKLIPPTHEVSILSKMDDAEKSVQVKVEV